MFSTLAGIGCPKTADGAHRIAALIDFAGAITLLVLGILALYGIGGFNLPPYGGWAMIGGGALGFVFLGMKYVPNLTNY